MSEIRALLERQARRQRSRKALSWPEKIRMAEGVRESVLQLRRTAEAGAGRPRTDAVKTTRSPP